MKILSTEGLTKLIQLIKNSFISVDDAVTTDTITLADVATTGDYDDLINKPAIPVYTAGEGIDITNNVISNTQTPAVWGNITGTLSNQTDLQNALDGKANDSNVVHKTGTETITGFKTFTNKAKITSSTAGAILELESGESNTNFLLKRTGGTTCVLESGSTVGLFGTQSNHSLQVRTNYETRMTFDTSGNVTLAKAPSSTSKSNQVATTAWTISKIPTNNNQLTNGAGYITGITSSDVTTALGYTPYNSTNPNGYTSNVGTVTSVNNTQPDNNGNVSITIPDTSNLADTSLTNVTDTGYIKMAGASMPSDTYENLTLGASGSIYTAPANGWFTYSTTNTSTQNNFIYLNNETAKLTSYSMAVAGVVANGFIPAKKGDLVSLGYFNSVIAVFRFIYAQGSESEAS